MLNIPNTLTITRIALIPVFVIIFYLPFNGATIASALVFSLAAITDFFDGYMARRLGVSSPFGAFLDPVADKLMVVAALVMLLDRNPTTIDGIWMTAIDGIWLAIPAAVIIGREIAMSALREWMATKGISSAIAVSTMGKWKTGAQLTALIMLLWKEPLFGVIPIVEIGFVCLYIAAILTVWSMVLYLKGAWSELIPKSP